MPTFDNRYVVISDAERKLDRMIDRSMQPLREKLDALFAEVSAFRPAVAPAPRAEPRAPSVLMGEFKANISPGMRAVNVDLARRIEGVQLEARKHGTTLTWSEARQISIAEGFKPE